MRRTRTAAGSTCCPVKHPYGNFQKPVRPAAGEIAPKHCIAGLVDHRMDIDRSAEPGMPWVKKLAPVGNVGVLAFSCTPMSDPTARSGTTSRLPRTIPMASPARQRERAGKIQLPAVQGWGAMHRLNRLSVSMREPQGAGQAASPSMIPANPPLSLHRFQRL